MALHDIVCLILHAALHSIMHESDIVKILQLTHTHTFMYICIHTYTRTYTHSNIYTRHTHHTQSTLRHFLNEAGGSERILSPKGFPTNKII